MRSCVGKRNKAGEARDKEAKTACSGAFQLGGEGGGSGEQGNPEFWLQVHWAPLET